MLVWLKQGYKCFSAANIDSIVSAELPKKDVDPMLYDIVSQFMIHAPCGEMNCNFPYMRGGVCSKSFPKQYKSQSVFEKNGFPTYKRREDPTKFVLKNGIKVDNSFVVPYNSELLLR